MTALEAMAEVVDDPFEYARFYCPSTYKFNIADDFLGLCARMNESEPNNKMCMQCWLQEVALRTDK